MFKKKCKRCDTKVSKNFQFCPSCGANINSKKNKEEYGMLGIDDSFDQDQQNLQQPNTNSLFGDLGSGVLNKMLASSIKMLEKEIQKEMRQNQNNRNPNQDQPNIPKNNFQLFINGKKVNLNNLQQPTQFQQPQQNRQTTNRPIPKPSKETLEKSAKLPRQTPTSKLQRQRDKIVYELNVPGIHDLDQILINKLEDSTEIKAYAKDKVYTKNLPIKLALISYYLKKQKLFLEFQGK